MSSVKKEILKKVQYILENEKDENVLWQLREELTPYETRLGMGESSPLIRSQFSEKELSEINEGYERSMNSENMVPHDKVMENIWKNLEKYTGKV